MESVLNILSNDAVANALSLVIAGIITWAFAKWKKSTGDDKNKQVAIEALETSVNHLWVTEVKALKESLKDKKLSAEEKKRLTETAITHAKIIAKDEGIDLLKVYSKDALEWLVSKIVRKRKK